jgi:hypothetical protein
MATIYEIHKNGEPTKYHGLFQHKEAAQKYIDEMNHQFISNVMREANRMNGAIRGANKFVFHEMIDSVAKPPWTVRKRNVDSSYR